jgi:hypothetical protein
MRLYAEISRMRVLSSEVVVAIAQQIVRGITETYLEPNKTFPQLRQMAETGLLDAVRNFSESCRIESTSLGFGPPD